MTKKIRTYSADFKADKGNLICTKEYDPELMTIIEENERLRRDLKVAQKERDILNKGG